MQASVTRLLSSSPQANLHQTTSNGTNILHMAAEADAYEAVEVMCCCTASACAPSSWEES